MNSKVVVFICVVGAAAASVDPLPQYSYGYDVQDALTGDYKGHTEQRNGDLVTGSYSVIDPDGTKRIVDYAADPINGFNAVVRREPLFAAAPARFVAPGPVFAPAPAPAPVFAPAPAPIVARAPVFGPAPVVARAPVFGPAPAPLLAPRLPYFV